MSDSAFKELRDDYLLFAQEQAALARAQALAEAEAIARNIGAQYSGNIAKIIADAIAALTSAPGELK
jgi:hypothetical protein